MKRIRIVVLLPTFLFIFACNRICIAQSTQMLTKYEWSCKFSARDYSYTPPTTWEKTYLLSPGGNSFEVDGDEPNTEVSGAWSVSGSGVRIHLVQKTGYGFPDHTWTISGELVNERHIQGNMEIQSAEAGGQQMHAFTQTVPVSCETSKLAPGQSEEQPPSRTSESLSADAPSLPAGSVEPRNKPVPTSDVGTSTKSGTRNAAVRADASHLTLSALAVDSMHFRTTEDTAHIRFTLTDTDKNARIDWYLNCELKISSVNSGGSAHVDPNRQRASGKGVATGTYVIATVSLLNATWLSTSQPSAKCTIQGSDSQSKVFKTIYFKIGK